MLAAILVTLISMEGYEFLRKEIFTLVLWSTMFPYSSPLVRSSKDSTCMKVAKDYAKQNKIMRLFGALICLGRNNLQVCLSRAGTFLNCINGCLMALIIIITIIFFTYWLDKKLRYNLQFGQAGAQNIFLALRYVYIRKNATTAPTIIPPVVSQNANCIKHNRK